MADFSDLIMQMEKHEAAPTLFEIGHRLEGELYWETVGDQWERCESHYRQMILWKHLLKGETLHGRHDIAERHFMCGSEEDQEWLRDKIELNQAIPVYRGGMYGWSWTTDLEKASWFASRTPHDGFGRLFTGAIRPENIIAYRSGRGESEIIADTAHIHLTGRKKWPVEAAPMERFAQMVQSAFCENSFDWGRNMALLHLMPDSGEGRPQMFDKQVEWLTDLAIYAASLGAATMHLRLSEQVRGMHAGKAEVTKLPIGTDG